MSSATGPKSEMEEKCNGDFSSEWRRASKRKVVKEGRKGGERGLEGMEGGRGRNVKTCESLRREVSFYCEKKSSAPVSITAPFR